MRKPCGFVWAFGPARCAKGSSRDSFRYLKSNKGGKKQRCQSVWLILNDTAYTVDNDGPCKDWEGVRNFRMKIYFKNYRQKRRVTFFTCQNEIKSKA